MLTDTIADMSQDTSIHEFIKQNAPSDACLCIFTDMDAIPEVHTVTTGQVKALDKAVWF